jgi:hypothetical protein
LLASTEAFFKKEIIHFLKNIEIDSEGWLRTKLYDKRDDFNFQNYIFLGEIAYTMLAPNYLESSDHFVG